MVNGIEQASESKYVCPKCGESDGLAVVVKAWAGLHQDPADDNIETDTDSDWTPDHDHEWGGDSPMKCMDCGFGGVAKDFDRDYVAYGIEREYDVEVCRSGHGTKSIRVKAHSARLAEFAAIDAAGNEVFSEHDADYQAMGAAEVVD